MPKAVGKNFSPYYPDEMSNKYASIQSTDFSGQILADSTVEDINAFEIYNIKEKLKMYNPKSSLPELEDMSFLRDLGLIKEDEGVDKLTYLHYSAGNMEEYDSRLALKQPIISVIDC